MKTIDLIQGSPEWLAHRAQHFNASDAPAMMGVSSYATRTELLALLKSGIAPEVDPATQRRFDDGHRFEALARPLAEQIVGEDLYPITGTEGRYSASFDGLTMMNDVAFEHKTLNSVLSDVLHADCKGHELPLEYRIQMEQQCLVSGCERVLFMASKWDGETLVKERHCWYCPDAELRAQIVAGWAQFEKDLAEFVPTEAAPKVIAEAAESLPAVSVRMDGAIAVISNLDLFGQHLKKFVAQIDKDPSTDQAFANCEAAVKTLKKAEDALDAAEAQALAQIDPVESMRRAVADFKDLARTNRLMLEKLVKARKETIKAEIVAGGVAAFAKYVRELNASLPADYMPQVPADFGGCIKGLKSVDSIRNSVDTELARVKIEANDIANKIRANVAQLDAANAPMLFADIKSLVLKSPEDLAAVIAQRVSAEDKRKADEREKIRAEEAARIERENAAKEAAAKAEAERIEQAETKRVQDEIQAKMREAERMAREQAEVSRQGADALAHAVAAAQSKPVAERDPSMDGLAFAMPAGKVLSDKAEADKSAIAFIDRIEADNGTRMTLGQINDRLAPVSISVAGLSSLGFDPVEQVKASRLYRECDLPAICKAISAHVLAAVEVEVM